MKVVAVVVTGIGVPPLKETVLLAGFATAVKYVVVPALLVMRTSLRDSNELAPVRVTVSAVTLSVPLLVRRVARAPKIYDPAADTLAVWTAASGKGQVPNECSMISLYRGRLILAGDPVAPHAF